MAIDGPTLLLLSLGIAAIGAGFLAIEWRALREHALGYWSAGFATIVCGCALSTLRMDDAFMIGVWGADGLLIVAHLFFLTGFARFAGRRVTPLWWMIMLPWVLPLLPPFDVDRLQVLGVFNAALVAVVALRIGVLASVPAADGRPTVSWLGMVFLLHGAFYCLKTALIFQPGTYVRVEGFGGPLIPLSLFEGVIVEVLLTLLMAVTVRGRREGRITALAERDPLTNVLNRRGFDDRARRLLLRTSASAPLGALMLLDLDHFKSVNDSFGHAQGDNTLIALTSVLESILPADALIGRLGGDEFVVLLPTARRAMVRALGEAICSEFAQLNRCHNAVPIAATVSIGAAMV
ncbi:MAG: GGDEF domain-containing protein [Sphingomonas sp.]